MPTYEYRCPNDHAFEVFQKMSEDPGAPCPECGEAAERQFSAGAGFLFKGDGFYITDYRSDSYRKKAASEQAASGGDSGSKPASGGSGDAGSGGSGGSATSGSDA